MNLAIDIGNTNLKIGVFDNGELKDSFRLASAAKKTSDEYWMLFKDMLSDRHIDIKDINGFIMSSVNPNLNYTIEHLISHYFNIKPMVVGAGLKTGIHIKYDNPKEVGSDRIAGAVAAYKTYGGPCIVMDCGTATTFNVVSEKGEFLGGAISFGLKTASDALYQAAARLPKVELVAPPTAVNKSTLTNMQSGIIFGFVGMVEYMINKIKKEIGEAKVIATGGMSEIVKSQSNVIDHLDRSLTLRGLDIIYNLNK